MAHVNGEETSPVCTSTSASKTEAPEAAFLVFNSHYVTWLVLTDERVSWTTDHTRATRLREAEASKIARDFGWTVKHKDRVRL